MESENLETNGTIFIASDVLEVLLDLPEGISVPRPGIEVPIKGDFRKAFGDVTSTYLAPEYVVSEQAPSLVLDKVHYLKEEH